MATPNLPSILHGRGPTLPVPPHDYQVFTYVASGAADDDDVATIVFKQGGSSGTTVATMTFAYVGSTNNVSSVTLSV